MVCVEKSITEPWLKLNLLLNKTQTVCYSVLFLLSTGSVCVEYRECFLSDCVSCWLIGTMYWLQKGDALWPWDVHRISKQMTSWLVYVHRIMMSRCYKPAFDMGSFIFYCPISLQNGIQWVERPSSYLVFFPPLSVCPKIDLRWCQKGSPLCFICSSAICLSVNLSQRWKLTSGFTLSMLYWSKLSHLTFLLPFALKFPVVKSRYYFFVFIYTS